MNGFSFYEDLLEEVLLKLVEKTKKLYVLFALEDWLSTMNFWFLDVGGCQWHLAFVKFQLCRLTTQKHNYNKVIWSNQDKWWSFKLCLTNMDWGKNEGANLWTMVAILNVIVSCESLGLKEPFQGTCFGHAMLKACQYDTTNNKVSMGFHNIFI